MKLSQSEGQAQRSAAAGREGRILPMTELFSGQSVTNLGLSSMKNITLLQPARIMFGDGCSRDLVTYLSGLGFKTIFIVTSPTVFAGMGGMLADFKQAGINPVVYGQISPEPTLTDFEDCLRAAREQPLDAVVGMGGGSALDVAKLVAALADGAQTIQQVLGINQLAGRKLFLACLPTTAGTGSEVSPNAILLDEACQLKKAAISPNLVPDVACVDPLLAHSVPPAVTAATGLDALTHCIEAYANLAAHPIVDVYALQGIRLIAENLLAAVADGQNAAARSALALGSLYGGLCLGPVNTAEVHALAYPLGSEFHVGHGVSNAVLLPHVLRFNLSAAPERYAAIARALGAPNAGSAMATAESGIELIVRLVNQSPMPRRVSDLKVPQEALPRLAKSAMTVTRLLKNNPRPVSEADALQIYVAAY